MPRSRDGEPRRDFISLPETQKKEFEEIMADPQPGDCLVYENVNPDGSETGNRTSFGVAARFKNLLLISSDTVFGNSDFEQTVELFREVQEANNLRTNELCLKKSGKYLDPTAWRLHQARAERWLENKRG